MFAFSFCFPSFLVMLFSSPVKVHLNQEKMNIFFPGLGISLFIHSGLDVNVNT